ncbi:MAG: DUF4097 family beta strand repeat protein [Candidatus Eisenbacteria bacterium]|nr:DUF4097 family beta strand repeat protein [Candidatus Eisenbacteria bacterium]
MTIAILAAACAAVMGVTAVVEAGDPAPAARVVVVTAATQTDTTVAVRRGQRLDLDNFAGPVEVGVWARDLLRVAATHSARVHAVVDAGGPTVVVRARGRLRVRDLEDRAEAEVEQPGLPGTVAYRLTVPSWMELKLSGVLSDLTIAGVESAVSAETVRGMVTLTGGRGRIRLSSINGGVRVEGARGRLDVSSVNQGVTLRDVDGDISVETVNGDIALDRVVSEAVEGATVNGDITYLGTIRDDGRYRFATHNGDVTVVMPEHVNAAISMETFNGGFESSFPVTFRGSRRRHLDFTLGSGGAEVRLESFQGTIRLLRAGEKLKSKRRGE